MKQLCVFDLDGTLINSLPDIASALNGALAHFCLPGFSLAEYRRKVGNGAKRLCTRCLPAGKEALLPELLAEYDRRYIRACASDTAPFPGIPELLCKLRDAGIKTAIISNKPHPQTLEVLSSVLAGIPFDLALGQREGIPLKPAPDALLETLHTLSIPPEDTLYIGDSPEDVRFGKAADVDTCAVLWGYRDKEELEEAGPDHLAARPADILRFAGVNAYAAHPPADHREI